MSVEAQKQFLVLAKQQKSRLERFSRGCDILGLTSTASGLFLAVTLWNITHHAGVSIIIACASPTAWSFLRDLNKERSNGLKRIIKEFQV